MRMVRPCPRPPITGAASARTTSIPGAVRPSRSPAKSICNACVRFHKVATVGEDWPRSIWLTMDRLTPESLATASSDRPRVLRASRSDAAKRSWMSDRGFIARLCNRPRLASTGSGSAEGDEIAKALRRRQGKALAPRRVAERVTDCGQQRLERGHIARGRRSQCRLDQMIARNDGGVGCKKGGFGIGAQPRAPTRKPRPKRCRISHYPRVHGDSARQTTECSRPVNTLNCLQKFFGQCCIFSLRARQSQLCTHHLDPCRLIGGRDGFKPRIGQINRPVRSEEHTSELQSQFHLV